MNRLERVGRGLAASSLAVVFAAISHVLAGASAPHFLVLVVTIALALPLSVALAGKRLSLTRLFALVVASQAVFHVSFSFLPSNAASGAHASSVGVTAHAGHAPRLFTFGGETAPAAGESALLMTGFHVAAAVFTVILLRMGERSVVVLVTFVASALAALREAFSPLPRPNQRAPHALSFWAGRPVSAVVVSGTPRRGPPAFQR